MELEVKNLPANAGDTSFIFGSGRSSEVGNGNPLHYSCLEIPWTEEPGGLQSMGLQRVGVAALTLSRTEEGKRVQTGEGKDNSVTL